MFTHERIYKSLIDLAEAGPFYGVEFDGKEMICPREDPNLVQPNGIKALPLATQFTSETLNRRGDVAQDRSAILWGLLITFDQQVVTEEWENAFLGARVAHLPPDGDFPGAALYIDQSEYDVPYRQASGAGMKARYQFRVEPAPQ